MDRASFRFCAALRVILGAALFVVGVVGCASSTALPAEPTRASSEPLVTLVRERFYDAERARAWAERHAELDERDLLSVRRALAELHASHTDIIPPEDPRYAPLRAIFRIGPVPVAQPSIGIDAIERDGSWFIRRLHVGGAAAALGLLRGDEIIAADGKPFEPVGSLTGRTTVTLTIRRGRGESTFQRTLPVAMQPVLEGWLQAQRNGTRVDESTGIRVGVIPLFSGTGDEFLEAMEESLRGPLQSADALILDLRDGFGGCSPEYVRPFVSDVPVIRSRDRDGRVSLFDPQWRKPVVLLVNSHTRSGKEVIARALQRQGRATVVGERTAGAVLGGSVFPLASGALLYLAVVDVEVDGERLEGVGVQPDVFVADQLPYAMGRDPQLARAMEVAAEKVRSR